MATAESVTCNITHKQERVPRRLVVTWLLLSGATLLSFGIAPLKGEGLAVLSGVTVMVIGLAKAWLVMWNFMEVRVAPGLFRILFASWIAVTGLALLVTALLAS